MELILVIAFVAFLILVMIVIVGLIQIGESVEVIRRVAEKIERVIDKSEKDDGKETKEGPAEDEIIDGILRKEKLREEEAKEKENLREKRIREIIEKGSLLGKILQKARGEGIEKIEKKGSVMHIYNSGNVEVFLSKNAIEKFRIENAWGGKNLGDFSETELEKLEQWLREG